MTITEDRTPTTIEGRLAISGFFRVDADDRSMSFATMNDVDRFITGAREHGGFATSGSHPVVVMTSPESDHRDDLGTVVVGTDDNYLRTIDRAIELLQGVRQGLLEAGHRDC